MPDSAPSTVLATGVVIYRTAPGGPRLLLLRNRDNGHWGFPKGRRDPDDAHEIETARREILEETGYSDVPLDPGFRRVVEYVVRGTTDDGKHKRVVYFLGRSPDGEPTLSPEHDELTWADMDLAQDLLPFDQLRDLARTAMDAAIAAQTSASDP